MTNDAQLQVAIIMGSKSDWETMRPASDTLHDFGVAHECKILSAHRTPTQLTEYMTSAEERGCEVFIGGAGGAAHLPGVMAAQTLRPVLGVPIESKLQGLDSLLSIVQMPKGVPVATVGIDNGQNAAFLALRILSLTDTKLCDQLKACME